MGRKGNAPCHDAVLPVLSIAKPCEEVSSMAEEVEEAQVTELGCCFRKLHHVETL